MARGKRTLATNVPLLIKGATAVTVEPAGQALSTYHIESINHDIPSQHSGAIWKAIRVLSRDYNASGQR